MLPSRIRTCSPARLPVQFMNCLFKKQKDNFMIFKNRKNSQYKGSCKRKPTKRFFSLENARSQLKSMTHSTDRKRKREDMKKILKIARGGTKRVCMGQGTAYAAHQKYRTGNNIFIFPQETYCDYRKAPLRLIGPAPKPRSQQR